MNFITELFKSKDHNTILIVINTLFKKRHYISCTINNERTSTKFTVNLLIKKIFKLYKLSNFIISDRESQFVTTV